MEQTDEILTRMKNEMDREFDITKGYGMTREGPVAFRNADFLGQLSTLMLFPVALSVIVLLLTMMVRSRKAELVILGASSLILQPTILLCSLLSFYPSDRLSPITKTYEDVDFAFKLFTFLNILNSVLYVIKWIRKSKTTTSIIVDNKTGKSWRSKSKNEPLFEGDDSLPLILKIFMAGGLAFISVTVIPINTLIVPAFLTRAVNEAVINTSPIGFWLFRMGEFIITILNLTIILQNLVLCIRVETIWFLGQFKNWLFKKDVSSIPAESINKLESETLISGKDSNGQEV